MPRPKPVEVLKRGVEKVGNFVKNISIPQLAIGAMSVASGIGASAMLSIDSLV